MIPAVRIFALTGICLMMPTFFLVGKTECLRGFGIEDVFVHKCFQMRNLIYVTNKTQLQAL